MTDGGSERKDGVEAGLVGFPGPGGEQLRGYLARPGDGQPHPGVVLIQEWWGVDRWVTEVTSRLAGEGFVVLAPDLYHGQVAEQPEQAREMVMRLDAGKALGELSAAVDYLQGRADVEPKRVGVTGFCMGGRFAWFLAQQEGSELAAVAPFYGGGYNPNSEDVEKISAPVLAVWGADDPSIPAEQRDRIVELLRQAGKTVRPLVYPGPHAFMNDQRPSYNRESAQQAWPELVAWFRQYLGE